MKHKNVYIIAGPNGAGKTTFAKTFLPEYAKCENFINADLIASGLSPFSPQNAAIKAGKLVLDQIRQYSNQEVSFGFETTLSGTTYLKYIQELKRKGFLIYLFFLWVPSSELSILRIKDRVAQGGHMVPDQDVKRRFGRSVTNFFARYSLLVDEWILFNNSKEIPQIIARNKNKKIEILAPKLFQEIIRKAGKNL